MENQVVNSIVETNPVDLKLKGFTVHEIDSTVSNVSTYRRRDFYKISLSTSHMVIQYADRGIEVDGTFLFFSNPHIPYSVELLSEKNIGYGCMFTEAFLNQSERLESLQESPLYKIGGTPILAVNGEQKEFITTLFKKMLAEQNTDYSFKDELIRNYISLIIHEALKMQPSGNFVKHKTASSRITSLFLELLERQFPIESPQCPLTLRTPHDYAAGLSVHVNHLNRSVKEITGKPTTSHIAERIVGEAKALLQHTNWSIAEIGYGLGFDYPTHFNNYFKRVTGAIPKSFRA